MRATTRILSVLLPTLLLAITDKSCHSQELDRYQPATPTVSPYLNLGRFNTGGLPNYYALVRPLNRQRQLNTQQQRLQRKQGIALQRLELAAQNQQVVNQAATGTASRFRTSGSRVVYRNTGQYYPTVILGR